MRISNRQNNSLYNNRSIDNSQRSADNLPLSSRCYKYGNLCNRRTSPDNLNCKRGTC
jgi:hypothetical protein